MFNSKHRKFLNCRHNTHQVQAHFRAIPGKVDVLVKIPDNLPGETDLGSGENTKYPRFCSRFFFFNGSISEAAPSPQSPRNGVPLGAAPAPGPPRRRRGCWRLRRRRRLRWRRRLRFGLRRRLRRGVGRGVGVSAGVGARVGDGGVVRVAVSGTFSFPTIFFGNE